ncbi:MAG: ECF-type sigma factor [Lysobacterales bacterium]
MTGQPGGDKEIYLAAYGELRRLAHRERARAGHPETINTTALVNEAWLKLRASVAQHRPQREFMAIAANAMRQVLIDHARHDGAEKRRHISIPLGSEGDPDQPQTITGLLDLDNAPRQLETLPNWPSSSSRGILAGLEFEDIAACEGVPRPACSGCGGAHVFLLDQLAA